MKALGIEDNSDPTVEIHPPGEVEKDIVRKYTLGGLHNTIEQMSQIQRGLEAVCEDIQLLWPAALKTIGRTVEIHRESKRNGTIEKFE